MRAEDLGVNLKADFEGEDGEKGRRLGVRTRG